MTVLEEQHLRAEFFDFVYGRKEGYACIASDTAVKGDFKQRFFAWPSEEAKLLTYVETTLGLNRNLWFCVHLLKKKQRSKETCLESNVLWADLDKCDPDIIEPRPQLVIESSPGNYQAIWRLDEDLATIVAEDYSRRILYSFEKNGADKGTWNADRLLRIPFTYNLKYKERPRVKLIRAIQDLLPTEVFDILSSKAVTPEDVQLDNSIPELGDAEKIIAARQAGLRKTDFATVWAHEPTPEDDWSKWLWRLLLCCFEAGLNKEEAYTVSYHSTVNKYRRDKRPDRYLWRDVQKAYERAVGLEIIASASAFEMPELIPGDNFDLPKDSFIDEYVSWGQESTDAPPQYHEISSFILLSTLLSGSIYLPTSAGTIKPNLWALVLGESSITRKTTCMSMARDVIDFIDKDILFATDGSSEGILTGISGRPGRTSMFYRDEVVGLFKEIGGKQYLAGLTQMFTQLYDGHTIARKLRRETVIATDPVFIFFGGGIKDQLTATIDDEFIYSGFLPRFLIVSAEADLSSLRRLGPPTTASVEKKQNIYEKSHKLYKEYALMGEVEILGQPAKMPVMVETILTPEAWDLYGEIHEGVEAFAYDSPNKGIALPTFERLSNSLLKMAILLAASRQAPNDGKIEVTDTDIRRAAMYVQRWGNYSIELMLNLGQTTNLKTIDRVYKFIIKNPGIARSRLMQGLGIASKRQMQEIEETLEARGEIRVEAHTRGKSYTAIN